MNVQNLPSTGDRLFLMHREVIVTNVYPIFRLVKIHYLKESFEFFVDVSAVTTEPNYTNSISIEILT
ncbi:hypothetical protein CAFE_08080 [Caprobacter fermentans]|uniref:Uncharacterized protein n=1 Tax=Caproicibacter fermentans TaxID=2576756 RepID=A0A6N8HWE2_9FIRM|nr:hypothetical protein [Caproicibacter fermentans]